MAAITTAWLVGSIRLSTNATFTVSGEPCIIPAGSYYLWDADPDLSLLDQIVAAIDAADMLTPGSVTAFVREDRKVQIDYDDNESTVTIQFPAVLATAIGFETSEYPDATTFVGTAIPSLLWSPGWPETTEGSPVGVAGHRIHDRIMTSSSTGLTANVTTHHYTTQVTVSWFAVPSERAWTEAEAPGELVDFMERVIVPGRHMKLYSQVTEDAASSAEVTWPAANGPYVVPDVPYDWYRRFHPNTDSLGANVSFTMQLVGEYP